MPVGRHGPVDDPARLEAWLAYYREAGIQAIGAGVVTMRKRAPGSGSGPAWFRAFDGPPRMLGPCGDAVLERMEALEFLQHVSDDADLMASVFRVSPKVQL